MDDKLRSVLNNPELIARIASAVKGITPEESAPQPTHYAAEEVYSPVGNGRGDKALALLSALRPFLSEGRRSKLESVSRAMAVANIYKNTKNL